MIMIMLKHWVVTKHVFETYVSELKYWRRSADTRFSRNLYYLILTYFQVNIFVQFIYYILNYTAGTIYSMLLIVFCTLIIIHSDIRISFVITLDEIFHFIIFTTILCTHYTIWCFYVYNGFWGSFENVEQIIFGGNFCHRLCIYLKN